MPASPKISAGGRSPPSFSPSSASSRSRPKNSARSPSVNGLSGRNGPESLTASPGARYEPEHGGTCGHRTPTGCRSPPAARCRQRREMLRFALMLGGSGEGGPPGRHARGGGAPPRERGQRDEAERAFAIAGGETAGVGRARVANRRGLELARAERDSEAAFAFKRACDLDRAWAPPRANLGVVMQRLGRRGRARALYHE